MLAELVDDADDLLAGKVRTSVRAFSGFGRTINTASLLSFGLKSQCSCIASALVIAP